MAQYLVLRDYQDTKRAQLRAGTVLDDASMNVTEMLAAGLAAITYNSVTMAPIVTRFLAQRATENGNPDLMVLLLASGVFP